MALTISRQPWVADMTRLKNADGTIIAVFNDTRDVDAVIKGQHMARYVSDLEDTIETLRDKILDLQKELQLYKNEDID